MQELIKDPHFKVEIDFNSTSPSPEAGIWKGQNICVNEDASGVKVPSNPGEAIIKHQLKVEHWSVLNFGTATLRFFGFPHNVVSQITRHHESHFLVQSMRYTGNRLLEYDGDVEQLEKLIYLRPKGVYYDRKGTKYDYTTERRNRDLTFAHQSVLLYRGKIREGQPYEMARGGLLYDFRQDFTISATIKDWFHLLDQRTKADAQLEIRTLAYMALDELEKWSPTLFGWYREKRAGKARLAP